MPPASAAADGLAEAKATCEAARVFKDCEYRTRTRWSRARRVIGKGDRLSGGPDPRFVVTSKSNDEVDARGLYEDFYCDRGEMENRIKEKRLMLFADRTSTHWLKVRRRVVRAARS